MQSVSLKYLMDVKKRLERAGGEDAWLAVKAIEEFVKIRESAEKNEGYKVLKFVWGRVSMSLDLETHRPESQEDMEKLEGELASLAHSVRFYEGSDS